MQNAHQLSSSSTSTMIGATTTFYNDEVHGTLQDGEMDYNSYLQHFPQAQFPGYTQQQAYAQYPSHGLSQTGQYLPTPPSVSPTSTSAPNLAGPTNNSYYTLQAPIEQPPQQTRSFDEGTSSNRNQQQQTGSGSRRKPTKATAGDSAAATASRKRQKRKSFEDSARVEASDSDDDDDADERADEQKPTARLPGACRYCKRLKMKCDFPSPEATTCRRCKSGGHQCVVEGRKPRSGPNKREFLLAQLRQKEAIIDSLLKQINNPAHATPLNLVLPHNASINSPDAQTNKDGVQAWLERLEGASVRTAGAGRGANAFVLDSRAEHDEDDEDDDGAVATHEDEVEDGADADLEQSEKEKKGKLHSLPEEAAPLGLIANLSLRNSTPRKPNVANAMSQHEASPGPGAGDATSPEQADENENDIGVANQEYFQPGPATNLSLRRVLVERTMTPDILVHGLVTPEDVEELFKIFYEKLNPFVSILDPAIHTPTRTFGRCPFLFTVVCAISSRYYTPKAHIYKYAMHFAKTAAAQSLIDGFKSVELCQAYLLLCTYSVPARRWEEDRSWLYLGLAIRIATDLNLHQPSSTKPTSEKHERELLNRTRTWLICFNLDRSLSTQLGKPSTIKEDFIVRNAADWYRRSQYNHPYDVQLCAYTELLRLVTRFHEEVYSDKNAGDGLNKKADFYAITMRYDEILKAFQDQVAVRFERDSRKDEPGSIFRTGLLPFYVHYSRLVMFSFGFQHAVQRGLKRDDIFFERCFDAACGVITTVLDRMVLTGYMRFAPDGHFVFTSFAAAFLLKLLRPDFANVVTRTHRDRILSLVKRLVKTFGSPDLAVDERHTPKLYSRFLGNLVMRHSKSVGGQKKTEKSTSQQQTPQATTPTAQQQQHINTGLIPDTTMVPHSFQNQHAFVQAQTAQPPDLSISPTATYDYASPTANYDTPTAAGSYEMTNDDFLASMQAINNPIFWDNVMMPGFTWPEGSVGASQSPSPGATTQQHYQDQQYQAQAQQQQAQQYPQQDLYTYGNVGR